MLKELFLPSTQLLPIPRLCLFQGTPDPGPQWRETHLLSLFKGYTLRRGSPLNSLKKLESLVFVYANGGLADKYESDPVQGENVSIEGSWKLPVSKT